MISKSATYYDLLDERDCSDVFSTSWMKFERLFLVEIGINTMFNHLPKIFGCFSSFWEMSDLMT